VKAATHAVPGLEFGHFSVPNEAQKTPAAAFAPEHPFEFFVTNRMKGSAVKERSLLPGDSFVLPNSIGVKHRGSRSEE
jgi:hypothetical protein